MVVDWRGRKKKQIHKREHKRDEMGMKSSAVCSGIFYHGGQKRKEKKVEQRRGRVGTEQSL